MAEKLKKSWASAKGALTRAVKAFEDHISRNAELAIIEMLFEDVVSKWKNVEVKHEKYTEALDEEAEDEEQWMVVVEKTFREARIELYDHKQALQKKAEGERVNANFKLEEKRFYEACDNLSVAMASKLPMELIDRKRDSLRRKYEELREADDYLQIKHDETKDVMSGARRC